MELANRLGSKLGAQGGENSPDRSAECNYEAPTEGPKSIDSWPLRSVVREAIVGTRPESVVNRRTIPPRPS